MLLMTTLFFFIIKLLLIIMLTLMNKNWTWEKSTSYECGFNPNSKFRMPFSIHFFFISCIFLIFDMEICLLLPMIYCKTMNFYNLWTITINLLILILLISTMYELKINMFSWTI
uniref:NADH dehydrogenase subunit 3 n=1 Tax=Dipterophagus daci TaxID=2800156 RepID=UPI001D114606|nr:NADH dehydrogenase subunit 3 [Dipterophagus daci]QZO77418.1 NADH dehydrogenase subunit 3 [Dipterophagus daci]